MRSALLLTAAFACLLVPTGAAMLVETPLVLDAAPDQPKVGDTITITITPKNDSVAQQYGGKTYPIAYTYDGAEGDPSGQGDAGNVTLAADGTGSFTWTIPPEVKDTNVFLTIMDGEDGLGSVHVAVENAPPIMFAMGGGPADTGTPVDEGASDAESEKTEERAVPGAGLFLALAAVAVGIAIRRSKQP